MNQILDAPVSAQQVSYAGFWIRVVALIIDAIIISCFQFALMFIIFTDMDPTGPNMGLILIVTLAGVAYFALMESSSKQGTVGKMAVGIKVVGQSGERISFGVAIGRYILKSILGGITLGINYIWAAFDPKKQCLSDKIVNTYVIYK